MDELRLIYKKRKNQLTPLIFGFAAFFVFVRIIMPQWTDIQDAQNLLTQKNEVIKVKEDTLLLLNSISTEEVEENYELITTALPTQKDIILIFSQLTAVSQKAGVKLGKFSVRIGGIYSAEESELEQITASIDGVPYLSTVVNVSGEGIGLRQFAEALYKSVPLVEITSIDIAKNDARYGVNLFYKPIVLKPQQTDTAPQALTEAENQKLGELKEWQLESVRPSLNQ